MAPNDLESLELISEKPGLSVKCGNVGSRKLLSGFFLRLSGFSESIDRLYGVQEVAGSNPVAPTLQGLA
jgi:hypothetical protein